jgi:hypothetical protein
MDKNTELLNYVYQNSQMGVETIGRLKDMIKDKEFGECLKSQAKEYYSINRMAKEKLRENGREEKGISTAAKASAYMSIGLKTLRDKSPSHLSEMMIQGSTMGIIEAVKNKKKYNDADKDILKLNNKLLKTEEDNLEQLKKFL